MKQSDGNYATNQQYLMNKQYQTADNLHARVALHQRFSVNKEDFHRWLFDVVLETAPATTDPVEVLELGCGSSLLWQRNVDRIPQNWHMTLSDLSDGMLHESKEALKDVNASFQFANINAQDIAAADASFDMVMANFMLYHVPDLPKAVREIRRVLKPGGQLVAATNGEKHMFELEQFMQNWSLEIAGKDAFLPTPNLNFRLETGEDILKEAFDEVRLELVPNNQLSVTEVQPILDYLLSMNRFRQDELSAEVFEAIMQYAREDLAGRLEHGPIIINKASGVFVAS